MNSIIYDIYMYMYTIYNILLIRTFKKGKTRLKKVSGYFWYLYTHFQFQTYYIYAIPSTVNYCYFRKTFQCLTFHELYK